MVEVHATGRFEVRVVRVFVDRAGRHGNPLGVILDEEDRLSPATRQAFAAELGYSETVFVTDLARRRVRIHTPLIETGFSGHAVVGAAWALDRLASPVGWIETPASQFPTWTDAGGLMWTRAELVATPPWCHERAASDELVDQLRGPQSGTQQHTQIWAWRDEAAATVRARTFAAGWGIDEDEANGSGCMRLAATLGRAIEVLHGVGSIVHARPAGPGSAALGGLVVEDAPRHLTV